MSINDHETPIATWDLNDNNDPILLSYKSQFPHSCSLLKLENGLPAFTFSTDGNITMTPSHLNLIYDSNISFGDVMTLKKSSIEFHSPLEVNNGPFILNNKFRVIGSNVGIGLESDPTKTLCIKGDTVANGNTYLNGSLSLYKDPYINHTEFDLSPLTTSQDTLIYARGGNIKSTCNVIAENFMSTPQFRGTDYFVNTLNDKSILETNDAYNMLDSVKAYKHPTFRTSMYDKPYIGFDGEEVSQKVPDIVRENNSQVSLTSLVGILVNVVSDMLTRLNNLETLIK
jgi:hypothetical protein